MPQALGIAEREDGGALVVIAETELGRGTTFVLRLPVTLAIVRALIEAGAGLVVILDDFSAAYEWNIPSLPGVLVVRGCVTDDVAREAMRLAAMKLPIKTRVMSREEATHA